MTVALRQALRCLPAVHLSGDEQLKLSHYRATLTAIVALFGENPVEHSERLFSKEIGATPISAGNACITIRQAVKTILPTKRNIADVKRAVELCLADSFDTLRDLFDELYGDDFGSQTADRLNQVRLHLVRIVASDCDDIIEYGPGYTYSEPLWSQHFGTPEPFEYALTSFFAMTEQKNSAKWSFWAKWYRSFLDGEPIGWELQMKVAMIPDEVWEEGAEAIAARIQELEQGKDLPRPDHVPELEQKKLLQHVQRLLASPQMTALAAEGAAETLARAIKTYKDEAPANCLPDQLLHLEDMPELFRGISETVKSSDLAAAKEKRLADQIEALNQKVADLEAELKVALEKTVNGVFKKSVIDTAGKVFTTGVLGTLGVGLAHFFGQWPDDFTLQNLRGFLGELESATPKVEENLLPPATDV